MEEEIKAFAKDLELTEEEIQEQLKKTLGNFDVKDFLTDVMLFDYLVKSNGVVTITNEDMEKIEEIRSTRSIEFMSEMDEDGNRVMIARLIYEGNKEEENEEVNNDN